MTGSGSGAGSGGGAATRRLQATIPALLFSALMVCPLHAQDALVLSGGGSRGLAHAGAIDGLEQKGFQPRIVVGTSMGAIIGGLYAAGVSVDSLIALTLAQDWQEMFAMPIVHADRAFDARRPIFHVGLSVDRTRYAEGLIPEWRINRLLVRLFFDADTRARGDFDRLPRRFRAVAADLETGRRVIIDRGNLARAIRASMAVPGIFAPVLEDGRLLVDGGIADYLPIDAGRTADTSRVVAVDVIRPITRPGLNPMQIALRALRLLMYNARPEHVPPTVSIVPDIAPDLLAAIFVRDPTPLIEEGRRAALEQAPPLDGGTPALPPGAAPDRFAALRVEANDAALESFVRNAFAGVAPGPYDLAAVFTAADRLYTAGVFTGIWLRTEWNGDVATLVVNAEAYAPTILAGSGSYDTDRGFGGWASITQRMGGEDALLVSASVTEILSGVAGSWTHRFSGAIEGRAGVSFDAADIRTFDADTLIGENEVRRTGGWLGVEWDHLTPEMHAVVALRADDVSGAALTGTSAGPYVRFTGARKNALIVGQPLRVEAEWRFGQQEWRRFSIAGSVDARRGGWDASVLGDVSLASTTTPADMLPALGDDHAMPGLRWGQDRAPVRVLTGIDIAHTTPIEAFVRLRLRAGATSRALDQLDSTRWIAGAELGLLWWTPLGRLGTDFGVNTRGDWRLGLAVGPRI